MTAVLTTLLVCLSQTPTTTDTQAAVLLTGRGEQGYAVHYGPSFGDMSGIAKIQGVTLCKGCDGYAARPLCSDLGSTFWARVNGHTLLLTQGDCGKPEHVAGLIKRRTIVELPYTLAVMVDMVKRGKVPVEVWKVKR